jgi:hypothetical protein
VIAFEFETIGGQLRRLPYFPIYDEPLDAIDFLVSGRPPSPVQFYVFSRALLGRLELHFRQGIYHEDALFTPMALSGADMIVRLADRCYRYRMREGSIMSAGDPLKHLADMMVVVRDLGSCAAASLERRRRALEREIGFALGAVRFYWLQSPADGRRQLVSVQELLSAGRAAWRRFSFRSLVNYCRLLTAVAHDRIRSR